MTPEIADQPCQDLTVEKIEELFLTLIGPPPNAEFKYRDFANYVRARKMDLGSAYAYVRCLYSVLSKCCQEHKGAWSLDAIRKKAKVYRKERERLVQNIPIGLGHLPKQIITDSKNVLPRRLWDLYAGRVVHTVNLIHSRCKDCGDDDKPSLTVDFWAISHSWTNDMSAVYSPVNQYSWKVPLPEGITLEHIRQEVLGFSKPEDQIGVEYCWLDLICLRQKGPAAEQAKEDAEEKLEAQVRQEDERERRKDVTERKAMEEAEFMRKIAEEKEKESAKKAPDTRSSGTLATKVQKAEQRIDVPTIGNVYLLAQKVIRYLNGLGRPPQPIDDIPWDKLSDRHWMRRAWTLQEVSSTYATLNGGLYEPETPEQQATRERIESQVNALRDQLKPGGSIGVLHVVREQMRFRASVSEVDKIAGLNYLFESSRLPVYNPTEDQDDAWASSVRELRYPLKLELLFNSPHPAEKGTPSWAPSWGSMMHCAAPHIELERPVHSGKEPDNRDLAVKGFERQVFLKFRSQMTLSCHIEFQEFSIKEIHDIKSETSIPTPVLLYQVTCKCTTGPEGDDSDHEYCDLGPLEFFTPHACNRIKDGDYDLVTHCLEGVGKLTERHAWVVAEKVENRIPGKACLKKLGILIPDEVEVARVDEHCIRREQEWIFV
ncbi:hypothetical protein EV426DRAFT_623803 [Tirmania nivea]|nr:hypothetical protein EV426DRAFT_623803 [Tirmania nivea]